MLRSIFIVLAIVTMLAAPAAQADTIKLATMAPKGSPWHEILLDMAVEWEAANEGNLKVRIYPGGVLGDEPDLVRKMSIRQIDGAMLTSAGLTRIVPDMWVFALPMLVRSYSELDFLRAQIGPELKARFLERGYVVMNWGEAGWVRFFSRSPMFTPDDLKQIKLFVWAGNQLLEDAWRKEGYRIVPLQATELFSALQSGMIDAFATTPVAALSFQLFGLAPYMLDLNWAPLVGATIIHVDSWGRFPEAARAKMLAAAEKAGRRFSERTRAFEDEAVEVMVDNGLTVTKLAPEQRALWEEGARSAGELIRDQYVNRPLAQRSRRLLREYREEIAKAPPVN